MDAAETDRIPVVARRMSLYDAVTATFAVRTHLVCVFWLAVLTTTAAAPPASCCCTARRMSYPKLPADDCSDIAPKSHVKAGELALEASVDVMGINELCDALCAAFVIALRLWGETPCDAVVADMEESWCWTSMLLSVEL